MASSDSEEEERANGYQPILGWSSSRVGSPAGVASGVREGTYKWPGGGVHTYTNFLYKAPEGDGEGSRTMQSQKSSLAARRAERMQPNLYTSNNGASLHGGSRPGTAHSRSSGGAGVDGAAGSPSAQLDEEAAAHARQRAAAGGSVYGLRSSFDPNEESGAAQQQRQQQLQQQQQQLQQQQQQQWQLQQWQRQQQQQQQQQRAMLQPTAASATATAQEVPSEEAPPGGLAAMPPLPPYGDFRTFLSAPGPNNGPVTCFIVREQQPIFLPGVKPQSKYSLFLEDGKRFLLAARKRKRKTSSNYVVSLDREEVKRDSSAFFGKLRSNFLGSHFTIYDTKEKPGKARHANGRAAGYDEDEDDANDEFRQELGGVTYQYNVLGTRGPRKVTAAVPARDASGTSLFSPRSPGDTIVERLKREDGFAGSSDLVIMHNKTPLWNEELCAYVLNFRGRVTEASIKNFQLVTDDDPGYIMLQFGKTGRHTFTMDYQYPLSALQAFCICLSSFDNKLACE